MRTLVLFLCLGFLFFAPGHPAANEEIGKVKGDSGPQRVAEAESIFQQMNARLQGLRDYRAALTIGIRVPLLKLTLKGDVFFREPDKLKVQLKGLPDFLKDQPDMFRTSALSGNFRKGYVSRLIGSQLQDGMQCYLIEMVPKSDPNVKNIHVWVSKDTYTAARVHYYYTNGAYIKMRQQFKPVSGFNLLSHVSGEVKFPKIGGEVDMDLDDYKVNSGLKDEAFN
ncbi:MAG: outer membrane lipoprotein-sorting protein [Armatimonadetes bacterium]|nr:outer membrane lipoprotein-sorting protein [Armatimonadota bacterium]